jgi:hypothetical protein
MKKHGLLSDDPWRFITICTKLRTYDLLISNKKDAVDLIVSLNESLNINVNRQKQLQYAKSLFTNDFHNIRSQLSNYTLYPTNPKIIKFLFLKLKLNNMAKIKGMKIHQLLMVSIYNTVCDWPEQTNDEIKLKYYSLRKLYM